MSSRNGLDWVSRRDYHEAENIPRAVDCARVVAIAMLEDRVDPLWQREEVELALEVLCDAPGGDRHLALQAAKGAEYRFRRPEMWHADGSVGHAVRLACGLTLVAEVAHRNERYGEAVILTSGAFDKLEGAAGSREELLRMVASSKGHPLAGAAVAAYAIRVAALRRAERLAEHRDVLRARTEGIVQAFLASGRIYPRSHAFATQVLFEQIELGELQHVDLLLSISNETRELTKRAWTTQPLVEMEHLRALGDVAGAKHAAAQAAQRIRDFGLYRHLEVISRYGYLAFD